MALSLGLPADTDPADLKLVQIGEFGIKQPAKSVIDDFNRAQNRLVGEIEKIQGKDTAEEQALKARQAREAQTLAQGGTIRKRV